MYGREKRVRAERTFRERGFHSRGQSCFFFLLLLEYVRAFANERIVLLLQMKRRWTEYLVSYTNIYFLFFFSMELFWWPLDGHSSR